MLLDTSEQTIHGQRIGAQSVREISPKIKGKIMLCEEQQSKFEANTLQGLTKN
jgi:hypothetical protein